MMTASAAGGVSVVILGSLIGGLGLFLLAVAMITDGLRLAAGPALRQILATSTATRLRGVASGALITGVVQSSSAVTVATIGFVNAGLLDLSQALGVVYGANVGTTMTGWLVAAVGFKIKVEVFALPLVGAGMLLRLTGANTRRGSLGEALAGFGLFFIGVEVLQTAFADLAGNVDLGAIQPDTIPGLLLFVLAGFAMTLLTQSSSAAIAVTLTAATGGLVPLDAAAAIVIGANVGTTSTAMISTIGATANARRVAMAHVVFNGLTGAVALLILPVMLWLVGQTGRAFGSELAPAVALALFHTLFNVLGVLLVWPMTGALTRFLAGRFRTEAEDLSRALHIDANISVTPGLALEAIVLELERMLDLARQMLMHAASDPPDRRVDTLGEALGTLVRTVDGAIVRIERGRLAPDTSNRLPEVLRVTHQIEELVELARRVVVRPAAVPEPAAELAEAIRRHLAAGAAGVDDPDALTALDGRYRRVREWVFFAAADRKLRSEDAHVLFEWLRAVHRLAEQLAKTRRRLKNLAEAAAPVTSRAAA